jgi:multiple sugar transport system permease protein
MTALSPLSTTSTTGPASHPVTARPGPSGGPGGRRRRLAGGFPTLVLLVGAAYCLLPVLWVVTASTKSPAELFSTFTFAPSTHLWDNVVALTQVRNGIFWRWMANTALYAVGGGLLSVVVSGMAGYGLAKFTFVGKQLTFNIILAGVLVPGVVLAIPQYLLLAQVGLTNTYWSVLLPSIISPYGIYLARIYAAATVPDDVIEAARTDGAPEWRIFVSIAMPMMLPGLFTVFLFQFVAIWNNFMLPYIMLGDDSLFPVTVGLSGLLNQGASQPSMYSLVITGALLSILPLVALFLTLQRFWQVDLTSGAVKG